MRGMEVASTPAIAGYVHRDRVDHVDAGVRCQMNLPDEGHVGAMHAFDQEILISP